MKSELPFFREDIALKNAVRSPAGAKPRFNWRESLPAVAARALALNQTKPMPGGVIRPFWLAATVTSAPQSSIRYSSHPKGAIQSTASSASCPATSMSSWPSEARRALRELSIKTLLR